MTPIYSNEAPAHALMPGQRKTSTLNLDLLFDDSTVPTSPRRFAPVFYPVR